METNKNPGKTRMKFIDPLMGFEKVDKKHLVFANPELIVEVETETADKDSTPDPPPQPTSPSTSAPTVSSTHRDTLYFSDGIRKIDLMIVYKDDLDPIKNQRRNTFLNNLVSEGLELELELENSEEARKNLQDQQIYFIKIHGPWKILTKYAEKLNMKMPIKNRGTKEQITANTWWSNLMKSFDYNQTRIPAESLIPSATFSRSKEKCFMIKDQEAFFTPAQRSFIVWKILTTVRCNNVNVKGEQTASQLGIQELLQEDTFNATFPLHDGSYNEEDFEEKQNDRRLLYTEWACLRNWYKKQPLWLIRRYFGDKLGLYFAWLGFYTTMLIPASVAGILCILFGVATTDTDYNTPSREVCADSIGDKIIMCPICETCELEKLQGSCTDSKLTYYFDNPSTPFFSIFMAFWAISFLKLWKRKHAVISWEWNLHDYMTTRELRTEFKAVANTFRINPVTNTAEPFLSFRAKAVRILIVSTLVLMLLFMMAIVVVAIIAYRLIMTILLYTPRGSVREDKTQKLETNGEFYQYNAKTISSITAAVINLTFVLFLHFNLHKLSTWLTKQECPRTQTEYENSFTYKMFLFQFLNYYSSLIYITFFKGRFFQPTGYLSNSFFNQLKDDRCDSAGCLTELFFQLAIIMIGKQMIDNFAELLIPIISNWWRRRTQTLARDHKAPESITSWEQDFYLEKADELVLFQEYLDMIIQYGFVTLFVAAFPLAPLFALLNNIFEIRLDAYKLVTQLRRPIAEPVESIGAWYGILQGITYTALFTNAFVIAYTSDIIPRMVYKYTSEHGTLEGYTRASLSKFTTNRYVYPNQNMFNGSNISECYYNGYYETPKADEPATFQQASKYYHVQATKLAFVALFEHLAIAFSVIISFVVPDVPHDISVQIQREKLLAAKSLEECDLAKLERESEELNLTNNDTTTRIGSSGVAQEILGNSAH